MPRLVPTGGLPAVLLALAPATACAGWEPPPPADGALWIEQVHLPGPSTGEATLVRSPTGQIVLVDVGNDGHTGALLDALARVRGDAAGPPRVDLVLITHFHADHVGGLDDLVALADAGELTLGPVVTRGDVDLDEANLGEWDEVRDRVERIDLCDAAGCSPRTFDLGGGATLDLLVADATAPGVHVEVGADENARSLVGAVRWAGFGYLFAGDLTGGGKDTPDVEGAVAAVVRERLGAPDVLHLSHHGIRSSTNDAWVAALLPDDGRLRHAFVGANRGYLAAPSQEVLDRVGPRLGGGRVWAPAAGLLAGESDRLCVAGGSVAVEVTAGPAGEGAGADAASWRIVGPEGCGG